MTITQNDNDDIFFHRRKSRNSNKLLVITKDTSVLAVTTMYMAGDKLCVNANSVKIPITCTCTTMVHCIQLKVIRDNENDTFSTENSSREDQKKIKKIKRWCKNKSFISRGFLLGLFCFSVSVVDPGEGRGGAGLHGVTPLTEGFFTN